MLTYTRLLLKLNKRRRKYFEDPVKYANMAKKKALTILKTPRVYLFGSVVKKKALLTSDIDLLIVSPDLPKKQKDQAKIKEAIYKNLGQDNPFEIHLTDKRGFSWYENFIKDDFKEI